MGLNLSAFVRGLRLIKEDQTFLLRDIFKNDLDKWGYSAFLDGQRDYCNFYYLQINLLLM